MKRSSTKCTVCKRRDVEAIDDAIRAGRSLTAIADDFGASKSATHRHVEHVDRSPPPKRLRGTSAPAAVPGVAPPRLETTDAMIRELGVLVRAQIVRLATEDLSVFEHSKLQSSAVQTMTLVAKLEGRLELSERRILASPALRRVQRALVEALTPWPEALRVAGEALTKLGNEGGSE